MGRKGKEADADAKTIIVDLMQSGEKLAKC